MDEGDITERKRVIMLRTAKGQDGNEPEEMTQEGHTIV